MILAAISHLQTWNTVTVQVAMQGTSVRPTFQSELPQSFDDDIFGKTTKNNKLLSYCFPEFCLSDAPNAAGIKPVPSFTLRDF